MRHCPFELQMGGTFRAAFLPPNASYPRQEVELDLPAATAAPRWSSPAEAAACVKSDLTSFAIPWSKSEPAIDALSSPCVYWQVGCQYAAYLPRMFLIKMHASLSLLLS